VYYLLAWLEECGLYQPAHTQQVLAAFAQSYPNWKVLKTRTLAVETSKVIVAVFCEEPNLVTFPSQIKTFLVERASQGVEEIKIDPTSPYWIHGRK
jgi:hypothetical protein